MKNITISIISLLFLTSCLEDRASEIPQSLQAPSSYFDGVKEVKNLGGFPISIKVSWDSTPLATKYRVYAVTKNATTGLFSFNLIEEIEDPTVSSYIHRDASVLTPGLVYTYKVNAVDVLGVEEPNVIQKSTVAFEGISRVEILSKTSARVVVNTAGSFSQLQILAHPVRLVSTDTTQNVSKTFNSSQSIITVEGLKPGTTYSFSAQAQINANGDIDGNEVTLRAQTPSDGYGSGDSSEGTDIYQFRNVRLVQGYGDAPNELNKTTFSGAGTPAELDDKFNPHKRVIQIIPNPFAGSTSAKFRVVRVAGIGNSIAPLADFTTTTTSICQAPTATASATATACVVCDHASGSPNVANGDCDQAINSTIPMFVDKALDPPPRKYFYTIVKVAEYGSVKWPEELPLQNYADFTFAAHVPDNYMVLVQRESVNYDMCRLLSKTSDPRKNNHCTYKGIAATPYTTKGIKIDLPNGFYDFGYNLFVDRHALACNWTRPTPTVPTPCGRAEGCFSLGANQDELFNSDDEAATTYGTPDAGGYIPSVNFTVGTAYASSPLALFNMQFAGNNCYAAFISQNLLASGDPATSLNGSTITGASWTSVGRLADLAIAMDDQTQAATKNQITSIVRQIATADPGPLGGPTASTVFTDRKRPVITGLTNSQAQSLCSLQTSAYGKKRLMRRREYIAATPLPSLPGEPGYTTQTNLNNISNGTLGQTLYTWTSFNNGSPTHTGEYGDGTMTGTNLNPGGCAVGGVNRSTLSTNPGYCDPIGTGQSCSRSQNTVVSKMNELYCPNAAGCSTVENADTNEAVLKNYAFNWDTGLSVNTNFGVLGGDFITAYLDPRNENARFTAGSTDSANANSNVFFIGSLATNKCRSRFGLQDPFSSARSWTGSMHVIGTTFGFFLSDKFRQKATGSMATTSPVFVPENNSLDLGVAYDYRYNNGTTDVQFAKGSSGYSSTSNNGTASKTCTANPSGEDDSWFTDNFFYFATGSTVADTDVSKCRSENGDLNTTNLVKNPRRDHTDFSGFLPILGIPLSSAQTVNPDQEQIDFANFLFSNQFATTASTQRSMARFYVSSVDSVVNMTTGSGGRWSYSLSESGTSNTGGMAWCAVEAE